MTDSPEPPREDEPDVAEIVEAFEQVVLYLHAYRKGAPAAPEVGWAIRNFQEVCDG